MAEGLGQVVSWYICTVVAIIFLIARVAVRWQRFGKLALEDFLLCLAGCCLIGDLIIQHYMWTIGLATGPASHEDLVALMKMIVPGSTLYVTSLWLIKLALVIFYKKIAAPGTKMQIAFNVTLGFLVCSWLAIFLNILFQCFPHDKRWSSDPNYQCDPRQSEINYWLTVLLNIFSDVLIICLPITMVMGLQMKLKQKFGVAAMFSLGIFVVIASIIRAYFSHNGAQMVTCTVSMVEAAVAIVAACLPPLRGLILGISSTVQSSSYGKRYELSYVNGGNPNRKSTRGRLSTAAGLGHSAPGSGIHHAPTSIPSSRHHKMPSNDSEDELVWKQAIVVGHSAHRGGGGDLHTHSTSGAGSSLDEVEGVATQKPASAVTVEHPHQFSHPDYRHHSAMIEGGAAVGGGEERNSLPRHYGGNGRAMSPTGQGIMVSTTIQMDKGLAEGR